MGQGIDHSFGARDFADSGETVFAGQFEDHAQSIGGVQPRCRPERGIYRGDGRDFVAGDLHRGIKTEGV